MQQATSTFPRVTGSRKKNIRSSSTSSFNHSLDGLHSTDRFSPLFMRRRLLGRLTIFLLILMMAGPVSAGAATIGLEWTATNSGVDGYRVYTRSSGGSYNYNSPAWQGTTTQCTLGSLTSGQTYYAVVRCYVGSNQSGNSNEVKFTPYAASSSATATSAPVVNAGADQAVSAGASVALDGNQSTAGSGSITSYAWTKTSGPAITLSGASSARATFKAPSVSSITTMTFQLKVTNSQGLSAVDTCQVTVLPATTSSSGSQTATGGTTASITSSGKIWIEAEDGDIDLPMEFNGDPSASSGAYMWVPNGSGNVFSPSSSSGTAQYTFNISASGTYRIWARILAKADNCNSFFAAMDNGTFNRWEIKPSSSWTWDLINTYGVADPMLFKLSAGTHTLTLMQREDGTMIDRILITSDTQYVPKDTTDVLWETGTQATSQQSTASTTSTTSSTSTTSTTQATSSGGNITVEAEAGAAKFPMVAQKDSTASSGAYIWVPQGRGNSYTVSTSAGSVKYTLNIPTSGTYRVWARILAKAGDCNSFFVAMDNGAYTRWEMKQSSSWTWDLINSHGVADPLLFKLSAGTHTLTLLLREDGSKVDKLIVTKDAGFVPK